MNSLDTIIIAAGGTGGHLYPGIALARELRQRGKNIVVIVRRNDAGREILEKEGISYAEIPVAGMPRKPSLHVFSFAYLLVRSFFAAGSLLARLRPKAVIGMGGYISFPVVVMGWWKGIPTVIHEQNYIPGLANRLLVRMASKVAISFLESRHYFPERKTAVTGNPVRRELFVAPPHDVFRHFNLTPDRFTVLVFGGSQGASIINTTLVRAFPRLAAIKDRAQFLHITGKRDCSEMEKQFAAAGIMARVLPYLHEIGDAYAAADLIICRSGATTVAELKILNKPCILIPFARATANHQEYNAGVLVKDGIAAMIVESDLTPEKLAGAVLDRCNAFAGHRTAIRMPHPLPQAALADLVLQLAK